MTVIQKKICLLGDFGVGKTSLIRQFVEDRFDDRYLTTIGVKISRKTIARSYGSMSMLIWDLAGSTGFNSISNSSYMQGTAGAVIVCDITRRETLAIFSEYRASSPNYESEDPSGLCLQQSRPGKRARHHR